jgi:hypothetical protein
MGFFAGAKDDIKLKPFKAISAHKIKNLTGTLMYMICIR